MPTNKKATELHAAYYLEILLALNKAYIEGGEAQTASLQKFDLERPSISLARGKIFNLVTRINKKMKMDEADRLLLDVCNTFPDAGAYLISIKLNAIERIQWLKDALQASQKLKNDVTTQAHLGNLGLAHYELGDLLQATDYFIKALKLAEKIGDKYHQGAWLGDLGNIYAMMGDHEKAIEYHERHLGLAQEINNMRGEGHALANLGVSYAHLGNLPKAIENYKQFLNLAVKSGDRREESQALMNLGFAYFDIGDLDAADRSLKAALPITIELGDILTQSFVMGGLADVLIDQHNPVQAVFLIQNALGLLKNVPNFQAELRLLASLGNAYNATEQLDDALVCHEQLYDLARSTNNPGMMCHARCNQVSVYRIQGQLARASELASDGLTLAQKTGSQSSEAFLYWQLGLILAAEGDTQNAVVYMKQALVYDQQANSLDLANHQAQLQDLMGKVQ